MVSTEIPTCTGRVRDVYYERTSSRPASQTLRRLTWTSDAQTASRRGFRLLRVSKTARSSSRPRTSTLTRRRGVERSPAGRQPAHSSFTTTTSACTRLASRSPSRATQRPMSRPRTTARARSRCRSRRVPRARASSWSSRRDERFLGKHESQVDCTSPEANEIHESF